MVTVMLPLCGLVFTLAIAEGVFELVYRLGPKRLRAIIDKYLEGDI